MSNRITHIRKPNVNSSVDHITHVKGITSTGGEFELTVEQVIGFMKDRTHTYNFYVQVGILKVDVTYQRSVANREYIKTKPDTTLKDNLLNLPQF